VSFSPLPSPSLSPFQQLFSSSPTIGPALSAVLAALSASASPNVPAISASASPNVPRLANSSGNASANTSSPGMIAGISIGLFLTVFLFAIVKYLLEMRKRSKVGVAPNPVGTVLDVVAAAATGNDPLTGNASSGNAPSGRSVVGGRRRSLRKKIQYKSKSKSAKQRGGAEVYDTVKAIVAKTLATGTLDLVSAIKQIVKALNLKY
jgi:hypothetical protein